MSIRLVRVTNTTGATLTISGQEIVGYASYDIPLAQLLTWQTDDELFAAVGNGTVIINNGTADITDVTEAWKWVLGDTQPLSELGHKLSVHPSSKPVVGGKEFYLGWVGCGDDVINHIIGDGPMLEFHLVPGTPVMTKRLEFDKLFGDVYVHEAYINGSGAAAGDYCKGEIWAHASPLQQVANLDYVVEANQVKYSTGGPGTGTHGLAGTPSLIPRSYSLDGNWNYDGKDLTPNFTGTGNYNIMDIDKHVHTYFNKLPMSNDTHGWQILTSDETAFLPSSYYIDITAYNTSDSSWSFTVMVEVFRQQTAV